MRAKQNMIGVAAILLCLMLTACGKTDKAVSGNEQKGSPPISMDEAIADESAATATEIPDTHPAGSSGEKALGPTADNTAQDNHFSDIPDEIMELLKSNLEIARKGFHTDEALADCYTAPGNEFYLEMTKQTPSYLLDYEIDKAEKINDDLYAFTILTQKSASDAEDTSDGLYDRIFNFVGRIDGKLYIIRNERDIPESIREGFDPNLYTYETPYNGNSDKPIRGMEIVSPDEVLAFYAETLEE